MRTLLSLLLLTLSLAADEPKSPLLGEWQVVSVAGDGLAKSLKDTVSTIAIDDEKITAGRPAEYTADGKAMTLDMTIAGGPKDEQGKYLGVYAISGSELKLHFAMPGGERPSGFTAKAGTFVIILKKR